MQNYKVEGTIGQGAHGLVLKAKHIISGNDIALKKIHLKKLEDGIPISVFREIKTLQEVDCEYVSIFYLGY